MSRYFLAILNEEVPDISNDAQRVLLKKKDKLTKADLPILRDEISKNTSKWTQALKKRYIAENRPKDWAERLREAGDDLDLMDIIALDVVGRLAVYGERPISRLGWISAVTRTLTWIGMGFTVWAIATHRNTLAIGGVFFTGAMVILTRALAVQDIWARYRK